MFEIILSYIEIIQQELLLFCIVWFIIGGIDDILIDLIWLLRSFYRRFTSYVSHQTIEDHQLLEEPKNISQKLISTDQEYHAVFIPAWQESNVIGDMLDGCREAWHDSMINHHIYVGCYPNDDDTIEQVIIAAKSNPNISLILCSKDGPTTKADCLNNLWRAMLRDELNLGIKVKSIILHDAEDRPHPLSLAIFEKLIGKNDIIQLPVIPIPAPGSPFVSGHYCDEFCESHAKAMVVREALGAALPLAGVGCAIERNCLGRYALGKNNLPFDVDSVTEDYELGLNIGSAGRGAVMVRAKDQNGDLIGTRAYFPDTLESAITQKSRWTLGIALSAWDKLGWSKLKVKEGSFRYERRAYPPKQKLFPLPYNLVENWMRLRDRKAIFTSLTVFVAYVTLTLTSLLIAAEYLGLYKVTALSPMMQNAVLITSAILLWRLIMRSSFSYYHYGFWQSCLAFPRMILSNIISILAARRAAIIYIRYCFGGAISWDKTAHTNVPPKLNLSENSNVSIKLNNMDVMR